MTPPYILGLNAVGFNTSTALLEGGNLIFAVEEERLSREKRTRRFPRHGISAAMQHAAISLPDVEAIGISWNPAINLEHFSAAHSERVRHLGEMFFSVPNHLLAIKPGDVLLSEQIITQTDGAELKVVYVDHHTAHASAFFVSPFEEAAILTVDGFGERSCATFSIGRGNCLERIWTQEFPHSLGAFYSTFTEYCGFAPQHDEWKLMGASAYGEGDRFLAKLRQLVALNLDGSFELNLNYFNHFQFHRPHYYADSMADFLGLPPNQRDKPLEQAYYDLASAAQTVFEEVYLNLLSALRKRSQLDQVVIAGGSALNSVANGKAALNLGYRDVFVPPVPDDSGGSLGAAYALHCQYFGRSREYVMEHNYLGPSYSEEIIKSILERCQLPYTQVVDACETASDLLAKGKVIGWFQGALEFGDRALGNRSILADPRIPEMKNRVNESIKYREVFRPFAPAILCEKQFEFFPESHDTPYMEKVFEISAVKRELIPAVTHVDGTGRLQSVSADRNPLFHKLISSFYTKTGVPIVMNTSFNVKGEPMVCSPEDAIKTYYTSGLDALLLGPFLLEKSESSSDAPR